MIASSRIAQAQHEGHFAHGISSWMRGDDGPDAVAASRIVAETLIMWKRLLDSKFER